MFYLDSLFAAVSPSKPVAIFIHYEPLAEDPIIPDGSYVHVFTIDGNS